MATSWRQKPAELTPEQACELARRYWDTDEPIDKLERAFKVPKDHMAPYRGQIPTGLPCENCDGPTAWQSRSGRAAGDRVCQQCGHHSVSKRCACPPCKIERATAKAEEDQARAAEATRARAAAEAALQQWMAEFANMDYVAFALSKLSEPQRLYLRQAVHVLTTQRRFDMGAIAGVAGLQPHHASLWFALFRSVGLLYQDVDEAWGVNPVLLDNPALLRPRPRRPAPPT